MYQLYHQVFAFMHTTALLQLHTTVPIKNKARITLASFKTGFVAGKWGQQSCTAPLAGVGTLRILTIWRAFCSYKRGEDVRAVNPIGTSLIGKLIPSLTAERFASPRLNLNADILTGQSVGLDALTESLFVAIHSAHIKNTVGHVGRRLNFAVAGFERSLWITYDAAKVCFLVAGNFLFITNWTAFSTATTVMAGHVYNPWPAKMINVGCLPVIRKSKVVVFAFVVVAAKTAHLALVWRRHYHFNIIDSVIQDFQTKVCPDNNVFPLLGNPHTAVVQRKWEVLNFIINL